MEEIRKYEEIREKELASIHPEELFRVMSRKMIDPLEQGLPDDVENDLREMSMLKARIETRLSLSKAISFRDIKRYNDLCYQRFGRLQDGEEFEKVAQEQPTKGPRVLRAIYPPRDEMARDIVHSYIIDHLDKSDPKPAPFDTYIVWKCKTLQNWKWLLASTLPDSMYYELTYNGDKHEYYLDAYRKVQNVVVPEVNGL